MVLPVMILLASLVSVLLLTGCERTPPPAAPTRQTPPAGKQTAGTVPDRWLGEWSGPEGTSIEISGAGDGYRVTIRNLDGPRTFQGVRSASGIAFERDGVGESIRAGTGAQTGMKWLADKSDCLVVKPGEGYCRK